MPHLDARTLLLLAALLAAPTLAGPTIAVSAQREGGMVRLWATMQVDAMPQTVWDVLTDYESQPRFVPGLTESRVISRDAAGSVVAQKGWLEVLFLRFDLDILYSTRELPPYLLTSRVIRGKVKTMRNEYRLSPSDGGTRLDYVGYLEPEGWLQPLIKPSVIRRQVASQLEAMAQEIERRQRAATAP